MLCAAVSPAGKCPIRLHQCLLLRGQGKGGEDVQPGVCLAHQGGALQKAIRAAHALLWVCARLFGPVPAPLASGRLRRPASLLTQRFLPSAKTNG